MVLTKEVFLPDFDQLEVEEADVSHSTLITAAPYLGKHCEAVNNEFMLCRQELKDPRRCVELGKKVTACSLQLLRAIKQECLHEFKQYSNCIDKSSGNFSYVPCRKTQAVFDCCMKDKLEIERPEYGYFCRPRVHASPSPPPPPKPCPCRPKFPDEPDSLPDDCPRKPARFTSRSYYITE